MVLREVPVDSKSTSLHRIRPTGLHRIQIFAYVCTNSTTFGLKELPKMAVLKQNDASNRAGIHLRGVEKPMHTQLHTATRNDSNSPQRNMPKAHVPNEHFLHALKLYKQRKHKHQRQVPRPGCRYGRDVSEGWKHRCCICAHSCMTICHVMPYVVPLQERYTMQNAITYRYVYRGREICKQNAHKTHKR